MTYAVRLREEAEADLLDAARWYEAQREGLGHDFLDAIQHTLDSISRSPASYPIIHRGTRRALIGRFPFAVYFKLEQEYLLVLAIMHGSRHPLRWRQR